MSAWSTTNKSIGAITLFVEDLDRAKAFYQDVFGLSMVFTDDNSAVFKLDNTIINLLRTTEAHGLISRPRWPGRRPDRASSSVSGSTTPTRYARAWPNAA